MRLPMRPADVVRSRDLVLVDIRGEDERRSEMGFLPASLAFPPSSWDDCAGTLAMLDTLDEVRGLVLYCTSGRRSAEALVGLSARTRLPLFGLDGGLLGWEAEGFPVCRPASPPSSLRGGLGAPTDPLAFRRHLLACVVGVNAELALDHGATPEPCRLLHECFRRADVRWDAPTVDGLRRVLDWCAVASFRAGGDLDAIADHLTHMVATLASLAERTARRT